jgi:NTE family protein
MVKVRKADIIIGVDVQDDLLKRKSLKDTKILVQINNLHTIEQMKENIKKPIFISSQILGTMVSFHLIKEKKLSKKGEEATFAVYEKIKPLGEGVNRYEKPKLKLDLDSLDIDKINLRPLSNFTKEYVTGKLRFKPKQKLRIVN